MSQIAFAVRDFLQPQWCEWHALENDFPPYPLSKNTCGRSSAFLVRALEQENISAQWKTGVPRFSEAGPEMGPYGFLAGERWEAHSWVVSSGFIIDVTADQFGESEVIVIPIADKRYRDGPMDPATPYHKDRRSKLVDALWPAWIEYLASGDRILVS